MKKHKNKSHFPFVKNSNYFFNQPKCISHLKSDIFPIVKNINYNNINFVESYGTCTPVSYLNPKIFIGVL